MKAFVVSSPYQILNSLQLHYPFQEEADIYVLEQFGECSSLVESLRESKTFKNVIQVPNMTDSSRKRVKEIINRNIAYSVKTSPFVKNRVYDRAYFANIDMTAYMLLKYMKKCNPDIAFDKIEDGLGDYTALECPDISSRIDALFHKLFGGTEIFQKEELTDIQQRMYVYAPEFLPENRQTSKVRMIADHSDKKDFREMINRIFGIEEKDKLLYRILLFDAAAASALDNKVDEILQQTLGTLNKYFLKEEIGIKLHPRRQQDIYQGYNKWGKQSIPPEMLYVNMGEELSDKILVGFLSTANVTPKLMFDKEPYLILLYKIIYNCGDVADIDIEEFDGITERVKRIYNVKEKIFVPESIEELGGILHSLAKCKKY